MLVLKGVDHVGIAVKDLDAAISFYSDVLGFKLEGVHVIAEQKIKVVFFSSGGETRVELLASLSSDSTIAKFIENRGEGIHHFAVKVENVEAALEKLKSKGVTLIDEKPRMGAQGARIAFVHPKSTRGVLLEFVEKP